MSTYWFLVETGDNNMQETRYTLSNGMPSLISNTIGDVRVYDNKGVSVNRDEVDDGKADLIQLTKRNPIYPFLHCTDISISSSKPNPYRSWQKSTIFSTIIRLFEFPMMSVRLFICVFYVHLFRLQLLTPIIQ